MGFKEDLTGKRFGKLVVVRYNPEVSAQHKNRRISYWDCKCDCGNITTVDRNSLMTGNTKSCGKCSVSKEEDISGQKFGRLTAIKCMGKNSYNIPIWYCKCDCGGNITTDIYKLKSGGARSCGCLSKEYQERRKEQKQIKIDLKKLKKEREINKHNGERFGDLTIISRNEELTRKYGNIFVNVRCKCGREATFQYSTLVTRKTRGCGHCNDPKPGDVFGYYTVINKNEEKSKEKGYAFYNCRCICGNIRVVAKGDLISGKSTNCGCIASLNKRDTEDITGKKFGYWTALKYNEVESKKTNSTMWDCQCECGNIRAINISSLKSGRSTNCGCHADDSRKEMAAQREKARPNWKKLKKLYYAMIRRCSPNDPEHAHYYDRGIKVCSDWTDPETGFDTFYNDMASTYKSGLTLDRINVNDGYHPDNCRWITKKEQSYNKTTTRYYDVFGHTLCGGEIVAKLYNPAGVSTSRFNTRMRFGYDIDTALQLPRGIKNKEYFLKTHPNFKVIHTPFKFQEELDELHLIGEQTKYEKLTGYELERFLRQLPTAEEHWGKKENWKNNKEDKNNG